MASWLKRILGGLAAAVAAGGLVVVATDQQMPLIFKPDVTECDVGIYCDEHGLIVHRNPDGTVDGGDTAQREGWYWLGVWLSQNTPGIEPWTPRRKLNFEQVMSLLEKDKNGVIYRHPFQERWNQPSDKAAGTSRDQLVPLIAAMGVWGQKERLKRLWRALPEDLLGKRAFNGDWRNALGQDGWDCSKELQRSCSPDMDCSRQEDTTSCDVGHDTRDCSASKSQTSCERKHDTRNCEKKVAGIKFNDPICEAAKATQNKLYDTEKVRCEAFKAATNLPSEVEKRICEAGKAGQNAAYESERLACEGKKGTINVAGANVKGLCEVAKTSDKYACEAYKQAAFQVCKLGNVHSGDPLGPEYVSLFMRALGRNPALPHPDLFLSPTLIRSSIGGDAELLANTHIRIGVAHDDKDDVGPDLNHIVALIMSDLRYPTPISRNAVKEFGKQREHSFGSYLETFYSQYGDKEDPSVDKIKEGIGAGWKPDTCPVFGAVKWYHRPAGANRGLAKLYEQYLNQKFPCKL